MATKIASAMVTDLSALQQAYETAYYEINHERSQRMVDAAVRDEDVRKLKFQILLLEDENEDLLEQLTKEEENAEMMRADLDQIRAHEEDLENENHSLSNQLRLQSKEADSMRAELDAYENMSADSNKYLKDKLSLQSELSRLKPELDHLRAEAASNQGALAEKLSLQREVSGLQVELENAKRTAEKARAKSDKSEEKDEKLDARMDELQKKLADQTQALKDAKREIERLEKELVAEKRAAERADAKKAKDDSDEAEFKTKMEDLRQELAAEKRERVKSDKALGKEKTAFEAQKSILDDKLDQFRTKLRSTKEKLKDTETELANARAAAVTTSKGADKNPRKRAAAEIDPDAMIGTPGDAAPAKRGKRTNAQAPVEKSMFSITPFLNRTMSIAPESPKEVEAEKETETETVAEAEAIDEPEPSNGSPVANTKKAATKKPLTDAASKKHNAKPKTSRAKAGQKPTLEKVTEEDSQEAENQQFPQAPVTTATSTTTTKIPLDGAPKLTNKSLKPRKSLADTTFAPTDATGDKVVKKKRKILGGNTSSFLAGSGVAGGKTLFDEDEDADKPPAKPIPGRGLFGARLLGKASSGLAGLKGGLGLANRSMLVEDGFAFSPLKKDRRAAAAAAAAGK